MIVTLVRHCEVIEEYQGKYNGHIDISLSKKGKENAKILADKLKDVHFEKVYCSDLLRAKETLDAFSLTQEIIYTPALREKSWGKHEGKSFLEIEAQGIHYHNFSQWIEALDGEKIDVYTQKIKSFFYGTVFKNSEDTILVVTHAGVIKTLLSITKNISLEKAFSIHLPYSSFLSIDTHYM